MTNAANRDGLAADLLADLAVADAVEADVVTADQARPKPTPRRAARVASEAEPEVLAEPASLGVSGFLRLEPRDWRLPSISGWQRGLALRIGPLRVGLRVEW